MDGASYEISYQNYQRSVSDVGMAGRFDYNHNDGFLELD
jgi:hypothetical protein